MIVEEHIVEEHIDADGRHHREDGPAIVYADGTKEWHMKGKFHREDGPAIEWSNGGKAWYIHGKCHREDGPAYVGSVGTMAWFKHGRYHREDGPAVEWTNRKDGSVLWAISGTRIATWKEYHKLSTLSPQEQMVVKLKYGEHLK